MNTSVKLSVAIPTFGTSTYLHECLESVADQTMPVNCIVCDGGSSFDFNDPKLNWVKHIRLVPDPGMVACWSAAADASSTEYIAFLADDNCWEPQFAERMVEFMESNPDCDVAFCNQYFANNSGVIDLPLSKRVTKLFGRNCLPNGVLASELIANLIRYNSVPLEGCIIRRDIWEKYGPFSQKAYGALDLHFFTKLLTQGCVFGFLPDYLVRFRCHTGSYSYRNREQHLRGVLWALQDVSTNDKHVVKLIHNKYLIYSGHLLRFNIPSNERKSIYQELSTSWFGRKVLIRVTLVRLFEWCNSLFRKSTNLLGSS